ncbi:MAG: WecB/TagA/CpsF family glycosyltransferase [bacterium]|nr:WecB/TagA/CpsF family glycosyltransferase [bacterium]
MKTITIATVPFHPLTREQVLDHLDRALNNGQQLFCVTPNPEICLIAMRDPEFAELLNTAQLSLPDGFGVLWAGRYLAGKPSLLRWMGTLLSPGKTVRVSPFPERVTGTDIMQAFFKRFPKRKVFLLGASEKVSQKLADQLRESGVNIVGHLSGDDSAAKEPGIRKMIQNSGAEVLFVAFGAPRQERWIARNLPHLKSVQVAMGIGGAFDFLAGERKRAPLWMRRSGLEWLFRLVIEPRRIKRIFNATVVFPWKILISRKKSLF